MTNLTCNVTNCINNKSTLCARMEIKVDGSGSCSKDGTCCRSFGDKGNSFTSSVGADSAVKATDIHCDAKNCIYNDNDKLICEAESILVDGDGAGSSGETLCSTFETR